MEVVEVFNSDGNSLDNLIIEYIKIYYKEYSN